MITAARQSVSQPSIQPACLPAHIYILEVPICNYKKTSRYSFVIRIVSMTSKHACLHSTSIRPSVRPSIHPSIHPYIHTHAHTLFAGAYIREQAYKRQWLGKRCDNKHRKGTYAQVHTRVHMFLHVGLAFIPSYVYGTCYGYQSHVVCELIKSCTHSNRDTHAQR